MTDKELEKIAKAYVEKNYKLYTPQLYIILIKVFIAGYRAKEHS